MHRDASALNSANPNFQKNGQGAYGLGEQSKQAGPRNQTSATLNSGSKHNSGSINGTAYGGQATGGQRVRDKLLINSGGLALNQGHAVGQGARMIPVNGANSATKSPQSKNFNLSHLFCHSNRVSFAKFVRSAAHAGQRKFDGSEQCPYSGR